MDTFEDKLGRKDFVHFIEELIMNSEQYKRNNENKSYVIALDSPWGTGKSCFLNMLNQDIEGKKDIIAVNYNAWENDYCDNAFNPLIYDVLNSEKFSFSTKNDADKENIKKLLINVMKVSVAVGKQVIADVLEKKVGIDFEKAIDEVFAAKKDIKDFMMREIPNLRQLNEQRESFTEFKKYLSAITAWMKDEKIKLVIIIDELDRCKPTFAIQTLEIVKHIFDIENIVFLFAIDTKQLGYSISSVYGNDFDSVGYLCRFFDYIAKMPKPDIKPYIYGKLKEITHIPDVNIAPTREGGLIRHFREVIGDFISELYSAFEFSLRDLDTLIQSYKIMLNRFLQNYTMLGAHEIYLFYLTIKYKKPRMFENVFLSPNISGELDSFVENNFSDNPWIISSVETLKANLPLYRVPLRAFCDEKGKGANELYRIDHLKGNMIFFKKGGDINEDWNCIHPSNKIDDFEIMSMGNVIFYPDLRRWKVIKHRTYREHLHKQLEMFNFLTGIDASYETEI